MRSKKWWLAIITVALGIVALSFLNLGNNLVYFYTPAEAKSRFSELSGKEISLGGMVQAGSVKWDPAAVSLEFLVTDLKGNDVTVFFKGSRPDLFKEGQGVVAEGRLSEDGTSFRATRLFVKHSEEYKKPGDHSSMNQEYLQRSLFKDEDLGTKKAE
jgi:cytochrome c-type biogenesis protein CcmE